MINYECLWIDLRYYLKTEIDLQGDAPDNEYLEALLDLEEEMTHLEEHYKSAQEVQKKAIEVL